MNQPDQLLFLQTLDLQILEKQREIQRIEAELVAFERELSRELETVRAQMDRKAALDTRRRELEGEIELTDSRLTDRRMQLNRVRSDRERQALESEINRAKEVNDERTEELLRLFESIEQMQGEGGVAPGADVEIEARQKTRQEEVAARREALQGEIAELRGKREAQATEIDANLLRRYDQILKRRGGVAVVELRTSTCSGCNMNLPPQFFNELRRAEDVRNCPNCQRILIWREEPAEA